MSTAILRPTLHSPVSLAHLATTLGLKYSGPDVVISGVALHTAAVQPGDLFVALHGVNRHGVELWEDATARGATAIFTDEAGSVALRGFPIPVLLADDPRALLGAVSREVYGTQSGHPAVFSVTGTNGKTSTAYLLEALMRGLGWRTALSTTAERRVNDVPYPSTLTTPEAPDIHAMLALAGETGVRGVAVEVSAQALAKKRLHGVLSEVAGFTNLSHDHFEDFGGMEPYFQAKAALFDPTMAVQCVICVDSEWGVKLAAQVTIPVTTVAAQSQGRGDWTYEVLDAGQHSTRWRVTSPTTEQAEFLAPLVGEHMVANATLAVVMLVQSGVTLTSISQAMGSGTPGIPVTIPGRIERVSGSSGPAVFVDAGRSADAYRHTLAAVRQLTSGKVVMVCGTSGNRDATKRPIMGKIAAQLADTVIITDDDPRREDPAAIRAGLLEGAHSVPGAEVHEVPDPTEAIRFAVSLATEGDSVLWSGPGSQSYRDIGGNKVPYSAKREAQRALTDAGWLSGLEETV